MASWLSARPAVGMLVQVLPLAVLIAACSSPSDPARIDQPVRAPSAEQVGSAILHVEPEPEPLESEITARERNCGLRKSSDSNYFSYPDLDFSDPASHAVLECVNSEDSAFSFNLTFQAADHYWRVGDICAAGEALDAAAAYAARQSDAAMHFEPARRVAWEIHENRWYVPSMCQPYQRFARIARAYGEGCAKADPTTAALLERIATELNALPAHDERWASCDLADRNRGPG